MYLVDPLAARKERRWWMIQSVLLAGALVFSLCWIAFLALYQEGDPLVGASHRLPAGDLTSFGGFRLRPSVKIPKVLPLLEELVLVGSNTRPDSSAFATVCLGLKSSGGREELVCGQKLFLARQGDVKGDVFIFSGAKTEMTVTPVAIVDRGVKVEIEIGEEKEEVILPPSQLFQNRFEGEEFFHLVQNGKHWGPDLFLQQWGGEEYRALSSKLKVEMGGKVYFVALGDTLWWDGGSWKIGKPSFGATPLMKIVALNSQGLEVKVWDASGYVSALVDIPLEQHVKASLKPEEIMTAVRSRSPSEITCQLGKRRVTVKEGDWWVHAEGRWRPLRSGSELEAFLNHEIGGELFIFEKIENGKEKVTLKGRSFDKMRTQTEPISLVFNTGKTSPDHPVHEIGRPSLMAKNRAAVYRTHTKTETRESE